ncbi:MAG: polysaccharide biosynthesis/export family protein [Gemmatimonadota bacterium]
MPLLVFLMAGAPAASEPKPEAVLAAVEAGPEDGSYTLVCRGTCRHRLVSSEDGLRVTVELPGVASGIGPADLPDPRPPVSALAVGWGGDDPLRILFVLSRPAPAVATANGRGLRVRFERAARDGSPVPRAEHAVGAEDLLEISVFEVPELNRTVRVSERGTVSLPLLGETIVEGLTAMEIEARLRRQLATRYVKDPHVSVFVREYGSKKVSVIGAVGKPGVYEMLGPRTLLRILSQAGGLTEEAGAELYVLRDGNGGATRRIAIDVDELMGQRQADLNIPILPGDVISVPIDRPVYVYVDGAVKTPGRIEQLASRPITLLQAIAKAGGTTDRANLKEIQILRQGENGEQTVIRVNLKRVRRGKDPDPALREGDIVVVPETFF